MYACLLFGFLFIKVVLGCPTNSIFDVSSLSKQLYNMKRLLGGHTDVDLWFPSYKYGSPFGLFKISTVCDLECYDFDSIFTKPCRWRNEKNTCNSDGDEIDFIRMKGSWGDSEGDSVFGRSDKADGYFLIAGSEQILPPMYSAALVSDPIQCQEGDGVLKMKFWTTPNVLIRVCTRAPSMGKRYQWCSTSLTRRNTKLAKVVIPGTIWYTFEIVIEAYNFTLDAFGKQGGAVVIDDITYNSSAIYECRMIPHFDPPTLLSTKSCSTLQCDFDNGSCLQNLEESGWRITDKPVGSRSSGIRQKLNGTFAYAVGPETSSFTLGPFEFPRRFGIQFCFYIASYRSRLAIYLTKTRENDRTRVYMTDDIMAKARYWTCDKMFVPAGTYDMIEFSAEGMRNEFSYVGLDQIDAFDPILGKSACDRTSTKKFQNPESFE